MMDLFDLKIKPVVLCALEISLQEFGYCSVHHCSVYALRCVGCYSVKHNFWVHFLQVSGKRAATPTSWNLKGVWWWVSNRYLEPSASCFAAKDTKTELSIRIQSYYVKLPDLGVACTGIVDCSPITFYMYVLIPSYCFIVL